MVMKDDKQVPSSLVSEKFVLSSFIKDPSLMEDYHVEPEWFFNSALKVIFRTLKETKVFDVALLAQHLHDKGLLESVGGPETLSTLLNYAQGQGLKQHHEELRSKYARRIAIDVLNNATEAAYDCSNEDYLKFLSEPITKVFDVASGIKAVHDLKWLSKEFIEGFEAKIAGEELPMGIPFGIPLVDQHLRGMHPQHYGIISGRSGSGKSTLAVEIWGNLLDSDVGGLYLILERTESSAFAKAVIQASRLHHAAIVDPVGYARSQNRSGLSKDELIAIRKAVTKLNESNLHIRKPQSRGIHEIIAEIRRYVRLHGVKVVFVDQIGLIRGDRFKGETAEMELRRTSNTLQELSDELGITIIVLCQENFEGETKNARAIEEDADWWLSIVQERNKQASDFGQHKHILIAKDSHNGHGGVRLPLILDKATLRFVYGVTQ
jgi:replicative DNA helicase